MLRPLAVIIAGIFLSRPGMPFDDAEKLAKVVQEEAKARGFDPLSVVSIVHFETGWLPHLVSENGEDFGLGQIRARYVGACRKDEDPLNDPSPECLQVKEELLDGEKNIRQIAELITRNRKFCKEKTGTAWFQQWLASYQGLNFPSKNLWCQPKQVTWRVINYHKKIQADLLGKNGKLKPEHEENLKKKRAEAEADAEEQQPAEPPAKEGSKSGEGS